jgi:predicted cation transporter
LHIGEECWIKVIVGLLIILALVLFLPFLVKQVEHNLEIFLFVMGIAAVWVSGVFSTDLLYHALEDPIKITIAVLIAGLLFKWLAGPLDKSVSAMGKAIPLRLFLALIVIVLGIISSVITAMIAALVLVAIVGVLRLDRKSELFVVVMACFSIGFGAALTPLGEPLSTIAISKLGQDFFYLFRELGWFIIPGVLLFGICTALFVKPQIRQRNAETGNSTESYKDIIIRTVKVYLFVFALTFLGAGFSPLIDQYIIGLHPYLLYWINMISAVLDNATLAAAEISPAMDPATIKAVLLGLLISGGMLIPGNIPNIIAAGKLNITSKEWARLGLPIGLVVMAAYFVIVMLVL